MTFATQKIIIKSHCSSIALRVTPSSRVYIHYTYIYTIVVYYHACVARLMDDQKIGFRVVQKKINTKYRKKKLNHSSTLTLISVSQFDQISLYVYRTGGGILYSPFTQNIRQRDYVIPDLYICYNIVIFCLRISGPYIIIMCVYAAERDASRVVV